MVNCRYVGQLGNPLQLGTYSSAKREPAAQLNSPGAFLLRPQLTNDKPPLAIFLNPALTEAAKPLAVFCCPPLTAESSPLATLILPPLAADHLPPFREPCLRPCVGAVQAGPRPPSKKIADAWGWSPILRCHDHYSVETLLSFKG